MMLDEISSISMNLFSASRILEHRMGNQLSGSEQKMLAIGRALSSNPKLLILDEAKEGLAPVVRDEIWNCLNSLSSKLQSFLIKDKFIKDIRKISKSVFHLEKGTMLNLNSQLAQYQKI